MTMDPASRNRLRLAAPIAAFVALVIDYGTRHLLRSGSYDGLRLIPGMLDLCYAENHGISFSLLWQRSDAGAVGLVVFQLVIIGVIAVAAWRARRMLVAVGLGLIIGGAVANVLDRGLHGAVFDYLYIHLGRWPLFVCNTPDIAISVGVLCLLADMWAARRWEERAN